MRVLQIWCIAAKLLNYYFNPGNQVVIHCVLSDWVHVQESSVVQREQHEYNVKKQH